VGSVLSEFARFEGALRQTTMVLLRQDTAPAVAAVLRVAFDRDNRPIPTSRLEDQVEVYVDELRRAGFNNVPSGSGHELCLRWLHAKWLTRKVDEESEEEVYTLTSHAQTAIEILRIQARDRATLSEHRVATLLTTVRRINSEANPDRTARVTILGEEIDRLRRERDRLVDGGDLPAVSEDWMSEAYSELLSLVSALPSDFARVEESYQRFRNEILAEFRAEKRSPGEVITTYLGKADQLVTATPEGRAFEGALTLLRDPVLIDRLRADLSSLLEHPHSDRVLGQGDRAELNATVALIRGWLSRVLAQRARVTQALRDYIVSHDAFRDHELETVLRNIEAEATQWYASTGPRSTHGVRLMPDVGRLPHLRERFHDAGAEQGPAPLPDVEGDDDEVISVADFRFRGGPTLAALDERLDAVERGEFDAASLGELFAELPHELRRPVEIFGLLHLANERGLAETGGVETYESVRTDGTSRQLSVPAHLARVLDGQRDPRLAHTEPEEL
jgi:hypothetical protein